MAASCPPAAILNSPERYEKRRQVHSIAPARFSFRDLVLNWWLVLTASKVVFVHASVHENRPAAGKGLAVIFIPFLQGMNRVGMEPYSEK